MTCFFSFIAGRVEWPVKITPSFGNWSIMLFIIRSAKWNCHWAQTEKQPFEAIIISFVDLSVTVGSTFGDYFRRVRRAMIRV